MSRQKLRIPFHQIPKQGRLIKIPVMPGDKARGENIYHQKHGKRSSGRYRAFRETVFARDNHTCQICGTHNNNLIASHIEPYSANIIRRCDPNNAVTFCLDCEHKYNKEYAPQKQTPHTFFAFVRKHKGLKTMHRFSNQYHNAYRHLVPVLLKHNELVKGVIV